jgi:hypothetical protein
MALVYNGFSPYRLFAARLFAAYQAVAARFGAGAANAARRRSERSLPASISDIRDSEYCTGLNRQSVSRPQPGSVFDARYRGLSAQVALIDAAICRHTHMR